jgi:hypothetical protein
MAASETMKGLIELATIVEAKAGIDTKRAITPAGLKAYFQQAIIIGETGVTEGKVTLATHKIGDAPIDLYVINATFGGYEESIVGLGYNAGGEIPNHHKFFMAMETDYQYGAGKYACEWYVQINNTLNTHSIRPFFCSVDRDTLVGTNSYFATNHLFYNVDGSHLFCEFFDGTPPSMVFQGTTLVQENNNFKWIYQRNTSGVPISLIWMDNINVINLGQSGYFLIPQDDIMFYQSADGIILRDRSDAHYYRIKVTNGVLGTEVYL